MPKAKKNEAPAAEKKSRRAKAAKVVSDEEEHEVPEKKPRKAKKVKDPDAPKKPCGAYMWFCKETRESVKLEHPDWSVTQIGRRLGELWKEVAEHDKKKFFELAEQDKVRYQRAIAEYNDNKAHAGDDDDEEDDE